MHAVGPANEANLCDDQRVITVSVDGQRRTMKHGETLVLKPGAGHLPATASVSSLLGGKSVCSRLEISMVNDDQHDNYFLEPGGRFPAIEEDESVKWLLCSEYGILR